MIPLQDLGTCYAQLGDRSSPPPPSVYERLNDQESADQEANSQVIEVTLHKTTSTAGDAGVYQNPDRELYVNVNQICFVGKVSEK